VRARDDRLARSANSSRLEALDEGLREPRTDAHHLGAVALAGSQSAATAYSLPFHSEGVCRAVRQAILSKRWKEEQRRRDS
jgi:hypothetical protein